MSNKTRVEIRAIGHAGISGHAGKLPVVLAGVMVHIHKQGNIIIEGETDAYGMVSFELLEDEHNEYSAHVRLGHAIDAWKPFHVKGTAKEPVEVVVALPENTFNLTFS